MSRLPCPVPYKLPSCERFSLGQLLCSSYNWSYKVRFFKSCVLKAEFYFWPDTFCPPLSLSAIFKGADADKVDEVQFDVFCFNLLAHSSVERVWGWHSLHCSVFLLLTPVLSPPSAWAACDHGMTGRDWARVSRGWPGSSSGEMVIFQQRWKCYKGGR